MKQDFTIWRNQILQNPQNISPLKFGISQDEIIEIFGNPDVVSTMRSDGKPLILKYHDIELHFDRKAPHGLYFPRRICPHGNCSVTGIPAMPSGCTTSTGRLRGQIGTVLRYVPRQKHHRLPIIWPVTRNIFTKTMR